jgi:hypothetical protein
MQMLATASTLYEAVEPSILWKQLLQLVISDLVHSSWTMTVATRPFLVLANASTQYHQGYTLNCLHAPPFQPRRGGANTASPCHSCRFARPLQGKRQIFTMYTLSLIKSQTRIHSNAGRLTDVKVSAVLDIVEYVVAQCLDLANASRPVSEDPSSPTEDLHSLTPLAFACQHYGVPAPDSLRPAQRESDHPAITVFEDLVELTLLPLDRTVSESPELHLTVVGRSLAIVTILVTRTLTKADRSTVLSVSWEPATWVLTMLEHLRDAVSVPRRN